MWHAGKNWLFIHQIKYWFHQFLTTRLYSSVLFCVCICIPLFMTVRAAALYPHLLVFVPNIYFNADILHKTFLFHTFSFKILSNCSLFACFVKISGFVLFTFSGIFTVEMCAKIFAMGFICHENSYLRSNQYSYDNDMRILTLGQINIHMICRQKLREPIPVHFPSTGTKVNTIEFTIFRNAWNIMDFIVVTSG